MVKSNHYQSFVYVAILLGYSVVSIIFLPVPIDHGKSFRLLVGIQFYFKSY